MNNKSYRIRTNVGDETPISLELPLIQTFDMFEILSLKLSSKNLYKIPKSGFGVIVGRVLANDNFGLPNAKISVFIPYNGGSVESLTALYNYKTLYSSHNGMPYNLLYGNKNDECHRNVGSFPEKRFMLDNGDVIEMFDEFYKYTTSSNNSGDYMIYGVPVGSNQVHIDVDLSDIGVLSQRPIDMMYKGANKDEFENPRVFKQSKDLTSLKQIISQNKTIYVYDFWNGEDKSYDNANITRCDVDIHYKFEPTCIFMGSVVTDRGENAISKNCKPSEDGGKMSQLVTGEGTIEIIRKTLVGDVESLVIKGNDVIDENGVWCYQIPMNLDYMMTDEYGNLVPTNDIGKGIPTRARVRFRLSLNELNSDTDENKRAKYLIPNNPERNDKEDIDYEFGTLTKDESYRDLFWNNVYSVKSYIPRLQKSGKRTNKYVGIKSVNQNGDNNPMPYNNIRLRLNFLYRILCVISKVFINVITTVNMIITAIAIGFAKLGGFQEDEDKPNKVLSALFSWISKPIVKAIGMGIEVKGMCEGDDGSKRYFPGCGMAGGGFSKSQEKIMNGEEGDDVDAADFQPEKAMKYVEFLQTDPLDWFKDENGNNKFKDYGEVVIKANELMECVQMGLAENNDVVNLNFQNDWVNGVVYMPLWRIKRRRFKFMFWNGNSGLTNTRKKVVRYYDLYCNGNLYNGGNNDVYLSRSDIRDSMVDSESGNDDSISYETVVLKRKKHKLKIFNNCCKEREVDNGMLKPLPEGNDLKQKVNRITGIDKGPLGGQLGDGDCKKHNCEINEFDYKMVNNGVIVEKDTMLNHEVFYYKPMEYDETNKETTILFATDLILLGSLNENDIYGIPQLFKRLKATSYQLPPFVVEDIKDSDSVVISGDSEGNTVVSDGDGKTYTEITGMDWGNQGYSQSKKSGDETTEETNGGLFFGLTCSYTSTTPKSCVNLSRICELGVGMDEGRNIPIKTNDGYDEIYLPPDGYISTDDIYDQDARSMFSTLNSCGLKTIRDEKTGFPKYKFKYYTQEFFDASLKNIMKRDFDSLIYIPEAIFRDNYKMELYNKDYVDFRFGGEPRFYSSSIENQTVPITTTEEKEDEEYGTSDSTETETLEFEFGNRFPVYKNSFYFYFGLKHGKTALDVFNRDFFGECDNTLEGGASVLYRCKGNEWCSQIDDCNGVVPDGYLAVDLNNFDLPCTMIINSVSNSLNGEIVINDIENVLVYVGTQNDDLEEDGYVQLKNGNDEIILSDNGLYKLEIIDTYGNITTTNFEYTVKELDVDVLGENFKVTNSQLVSTTNPYYNFSSDSNRYGYMSIAEYHTTNNNGEERNIGGYIKLKNINVEDYVVTIIPLNSTKFNGFTNESYNHISYYNDGYITIRKTDENHYMGGEVFKSEVDDNDKYVYYIGVPIGEMEYKVTVTQLCKCGDEYKKTDNVYTKNVFIKERNDYVMYINGVDSRLIYNFRTGWEWNPTTNIPSGVQHNVANNTDVMDWVTGFTNIGFGFGPTALNGAKIPLKENEEDNYGWSDIENVYNTLFALVPVTTMYSWYGEYLGCEEDIPFDIVEVFIDPSDKTPDEIGLQTDSPEGYIKYDTDGYGNYSYYQYDSQQGKYGQPDNVIQISAFMDNVHVRKDQKEQIVNYLNGIIDKRIEVVYSMIRGFWCSSDKKSLTITSNTDEFPCKYSIIGPDFTKLFNQEDNDNTTNNVVDIFLKGYGLLDTTKSENEVLSIVPQIKYRQSGSSNEYVVGWNTVYCSTTQADDDNETYDYLYVEPYSVAMMDGSGSIVPKACDEDMFNGELTDGVAMYSNKICFFKRPFTAKLVTWGSVFNVPNYYGSDKVTKNAILYGRLTNGFSKSANQTPVFEKCLLGVEDISGHIISEPKLSTPQTFSEFNVHIDRVVYSNDIEGDNKGYPKLLAEEVVPSVVIPNDEVGYMNIVSDEIGLVISDGDRVISKTLFGDLKTYISETSCFIDLSDYLMPLKSVFRFTNNKNILDNVNYKVYKFENPQPVYPTNGNPLVGYGAVGEYFDSTDFDANSLNKAKSVFYVVCVVSVDSEYKACAYSVIYDTRVDNIGFNNGTITVTGTVTGVNEYLKKHKSTVNIYDENDEVLFTKNNVEFQDNGNSLTYTIDNNEFSNYSLVNKVEVVDAVGMRFFKKNV